MTTRVLTLAALFLLATGTVVAQQPPRLEDIRAAWAERQAKAQSLRVEWKQTDFVAKGASSDSLGGLRHPDGQPVTVSPPEDHSFASSPVLLLDGDKCSFLYLRRYWGETSKQYFDFLTDYRVSDGKMLSLDRTGFTSWPQALIENHSRKATLPEVARPLLRIFRGVATNLGADDLDDWAVTGASVMISGQRSYELHFKGSATRSEQRIWVDPKRGYVPTRSTRGSASRPLFQTEVNFRPDANLGWVPTEWKTVETSRVDGRIIRTRAAKVTSCEIASIEAQAFDFDLPVGTRVVNETGEGPKDYITKEGGKQRVMTGSDAGKTYDEIVNSPGADSNPIKWFFRPITLVAFGAVGVVLILVRLRIRRRAGVQPPPTSTEAGG